MMAAYGKLGTGLIWMEFLIFILQIVELNPTLDSSVFFGMLD